MRQPGRGEAARRHDAVRDWLIESEHAVILGLIGWLLRQVYLLRSEISYLSGRRKDDP